MKKFFQTLLLILLVIVGVQFNTPVTEAALYGIVGCGNNSQVDGQGFVNDECTLCDLQKLAVRFVNFVILFATAFAALLFMNAGFLYVMSPSNPGNIAKGHHLFMNTLIGFVIILAAWLIVNLIMSTLLSNTFGDWKNILCTSSVQQSTKKDISAIPVTHGTGAGGGGGPSTYTPPTSPFAGEETVSQAGGYSGAYATEAEARAALNPAIKVEETKPGATTLVGVQETTIAGVNTMFDAFAGAGNNPSEFRVTGVTDINVNVHESGDFSHLTGYKVDFQDTPQFNSYVEKNFTQSGTVGGYPKYVGLVNGRPVEIVKESTHWDAKFLPN